MANYDAALRRYADGDGLAVIAADTGVCMTTILYHARKAGLPKRLSSGRRPRVSGPCAHCGSVFERPRYNAAKLYCSSACQSVSSGAKITASLLKEGPTMSGPYRVVRVPAGHVSETSLRRKRRHRAPEHILVAEAALGRPLGHNEVVHHINCDRTDNRPQNLLVCTRSYHAWLHGEMSRRYAQEKFGRVA